MAATDDGFPALMADVEEGRAGGPRPVAFDRFPWSTPGEMTGLAIGMIYQKSPRESSRRWVTIRSVSSETPQKMMAYCWLRKAVKSFRLDRVQGVYDTDGVIMEPASFFRTFGVEIDSPADPLPTATRRISLNIPLGLLAQIDAITDDRNGFVIKAVQAELQRLG